MGPSQISFGLKKKKKEGKGKEERERGRREEGREERKKKERKKRSPYVLGHSKFFEIEWK